MHWTLLAGDQEAREDREESTDPQFRQKQFERSRLGHSTATRTGKQCKCNRFPTGGGDVQAETQWKGDASRGGSAHGAAQRLETAGGEGDGPGRVAAECGGVRVHLQATRPPGHDRNVRVQRLAQLGHRARHGLGQHPIVLQQPAVAGQGAEVGVVAALFVDVHVPDAIPVLRSSVPRKDRRCVGRAEQNDSVCAVRLQTAGQVHSSVAGDVFLHVVHVDSGGGEAGLGIIIVTGVVVIGQLNGKLLLL